MTKRNSVTTSWATDVASFVVDAEVDTDHPSGQGGAGKTAKGWISETEPQQWENFNIKLREDRQWAILKNGRIPWDEEVKYKINAITYLSGVLYVAIQAGLNKNPTTQTTYWSPIKFTTASLYTSTVTTMQNQLSTHTTPGQNSHNDDIVAIGGSYKSTIDAQVKLVADATALHVANVSNPHTDTATNIGTLPTTGGSFTGRVNYLDNLSVGTNSELMTNNSTFVQFKSLGGAFGLGLADYHIGGRWQQIFTVDNFPVVNGYFHPTFVMPTPDLHIPMMSSLDATVGVGSVVLTRPSTLTYTDRGNVSQTAIVDAPAFEVAGLKLSAGTVLTVSAPNLFGARDGCISYTLDNVVYVKDLQFTSEDLTTYFGATGNVKNFRVWSQRLTPRQKLSIPR
jgi:hypothetical protein